MSQSRPAPIVVLSERIGPLTRWEQAIAEQVRCEVVCRPLFDHDQIAANAADATAVILGAVEPFDARAFASLPTLRLVARRGTGVDNVDLAAADRHQVLVTCVPDATVTEVAEHALTLLLSLLRRVPAADQAVRRDQVAAARSAVDAAIPLGEATLGVIGGGRIGQRLIRLADPLFGRVLVADPYLDQPPGAELVDLPALLTQAHAISLHAPLTDQTRGLLDAEALARLRPGAVVVNTARPGLINEAALIEAVKAGIVAGVGLDVSADERRWRALAESGFDNLVLTGHSGARGSRAQERLRRATAAQVTDYLSGKRPTHVVNQKGRS